LLANGEKLYFDMLENRIEFLEVTGDYGAIARAFPTSLIDLFWPRGIATGPPKIMCHILAILCLLAALPALSAGLRYNGVIRIASSAEAVDFSRYEHVRPILQLIHQREWSRVSAALRRKVAA